jgi:hypothetical protein
MPSTVIRAKFGKVFFFFFFFLFSFLDDLYQPKRIGEELLDREHGIRKEGLPDFAGFRPIFQISPNFGQISPESLLRAFWEKKIKSA